jgi:radical SAM superfamily enzyme YgiQ (UPF0313 family)
VVQGPGEPHLKKIIHDFTGFDMAKGSPWDLQTGLANLDDLPFPALDLQRKMTYAPILTSRGCPFSCEYCASSFLEPSFRQRSPENVFKEIQYRHEIQGIKNFAFYDDALLVNGRNHAFPLFEKIIASRMNLFFHTPNALHIKEITQEAARLMFMAGFKTIRLGLETTEFSPSRHHDKKVEKNDFYTAIDLLREAGFTKDQIGAYLLCGLPGQNPDDVENSMLLVKQTGILPVLAYYTPIPHTPMWETAKAHSQFDLDQHPVFTNNTLFPCVNSRADLKRISRLKNLRF